MNSPQTPRTRLPDARVTPRFAGIPTFCRYPRLDDVPPEHRPVDWALYGIPFDTGVTYRPGARFGPRAIRTESQYVKPYHIEHDLNLVEIFSLADAGDAPVAPYSTRDTQDAACNFALGLGDASRTRLFAVGGDHAAKILGAGFISHQQHLLPSRCSSDGFFCGKRQGTDCRAWRSWKPGSEAAALRAGAAGDRSD